MLPPPPDVLLDRLRNGRCVLFAGAGLSMAAKLPSWPKLLEELVAQLPGRDPEGRKELRKLIERGELLAVADHCQEKLGPGRFTRFMVERFRARREVPSVHRQIARLPLSGVVTTNYDKLFERAYEGRLTVRTHMDRNLGSLPFDPQPFLLKAHGDIDQPESLVLTATDYRRLIHSNPQIKAAFRWVMFGHAILFAGYSINDPDFQLWLQGYAELFGESAGRYALLSEVGPIEREHLRKTAGIEVLPYPEGRHESVEEFITQLLGAVGQKVLRDIAASDRATAASAAESFSLEAGEKFLASLENAPAGERARLLARPGPAERSALRSRFGREQWLEMRGRALAQVRTSRQKRGHVVVIPEFLGSELSLYERGGKKQIWLNPIRLALGGLSHLRLADDGSATEDVRSSGPLHKFYAPLLLALGKHWHVHVFAYDWRRDFSETAALLDTQLHAWRGDGEFSHIVAHGVGGLIARTFIKNHPARWNAMFDNESTIPGAAGGRLVMLGASQRGSLIAPSLITGENQLIRALGLLDFKHRREEVHAIVRSWPALYQMLPSPLAVPAFEVFYQAQSYGDIAVPQHHLDRARALHESIHAVADPARMVTVVSDKLPASSAAPSRVRISETLAAALTPEPHAANQLAQLRSPTGEQVPIYHVAADSAQLIQTPAVLEALDDLLETGASFSLREEEALL